MLLLPPSLSPPLLRRPSWGGLDALCREQPLQLLPLQLLPPSGQAPDELQWVAVEPLLVRMSRVSLHTVAALELAVEGGLLGGGVSAAVACTRGGTHVSRVSCRRTSSHANSWSHSQTPLTCDRLEIVSTALMLWTSPWSTVNESL